MGKLFTFFAVMWFAIGLTGGVMKGDIASATTTLTENLTKDDTTISVRSTNGFPEAGIVVIGTERIAYSAVTATTIAGSVTTPLIRGIENTGAQSHLNGDRVRTISSAMMNSSAQYNTALIADASGPWAAVTVPLAVFRLIGSYLGPPMSFLGTDLSILIYVWWALVAGMVISIGIALAGARRV